MFHQERTIEREKSGEKEREVVGERGVCFFGAAVYK